MAWRRTHRRRPLLLRARFVSLLRLLPLRPATPRPPAPGRTCERAQAAARPQGHHPRDPRDALPRTATRLLLLSSHPGGAGGRGRGGSGGRDVGKGGSPAPPTCDASAAVGASDRAAAGAVTDKEATKGERSSAAERTSCTAVVSVAAAVVSDESGEPPADKKAEADGASRNLRVSSCGRDVAHFDEGGGDATVDPGDEEEEGATAGSGAAATAAFAAAPGSERTSNLADVARSPTARMRQALRKARTATRGRRGPGSTFADVAAVAKLRADTKRAKASKREKKKRGGWWAPKPGDRITAGLHAATFPQDSFTGNEGGKTTSTATVVQAAAAAGRRMSMIGGGAGTANASNARGAKALPMISTALQPRVPLSSRASPSGAAAGPREGIGGGGGGEPCSEASFSARYASCRSDEVVTGSADDMSSPAPAGTVCPTSASSASSASAGGSRGAPWDQPRTVLGLRRVWASWRSSGAQAPRGRLRHAPLHLFAAALTPCASSAADRACSADKVDDRHVPAGPRPSAADRRRGSARRGATQMRDAV